MKKLFTIRDTRTNCCVPDSFFSTKPAAKRARDEFNSAAGSNVFVVTPGPDHRKSK